MTSHVEVDGARLEYLDIPATRPALPEILLLHEGLGCVAMWRDFPQALARATGSRVVAYSRRGFGRSSPRTAGYTVRFMHEEAFEVLPALRDALAIRDPVLVGHSTGASMALVHAGADRWPVRGVVAMAPFATVEGSNTASILAARRQYESTGWREKLARYHDDVDSVFYGWNDTWLRPEFARWSIVEDLQRIACPIVAVVGEEDPYSTPAQLEAIRAHARHSPDVRLLCIPECGHAPHRERPDVVVPLVARLVSGGAASERRIFAR